ncbi:hypothetical protein ACVWW5_006083 [Bradyrhizobium sp. LM3.4]
MRAEPSVQRDAPAARAVGVDQWRHLAVDAGLRQRLDHDAALPDLIRFSRPMLDRAAATDAEMRTERCDALRACDIHRQQHAAVRMVAGDAADLDGLAAERVGYIDRITRSPRDAVATMADVINLHALNHVARPGRIRYCRRRR